MCFPHLLSHLRYIIEPNKIFHHHTLLILIAIYLAQDPFYEPYDAEVHIATAHLYLQFVGYLIETNEVCPLTNFRGVEQGDTILLFLELFVFPPCTLSLY